ncbi:hypothetical protein ASF77_23380 [Massilia sp. Leaf139]|nr:hypothetical protein ASF77_23380 [Massilia sp. Leaf139]
MSREKTSAPAALAVTMAIAKQALRIDEDDTSLDMMIGIWIAGITAEAEKQTHRAFVNRGMRITLDAFPDAIKLSAPTFSVEAVRFLDPDGVERTLDPADYYVDKVTVPAYIVPARGKAWPATEGHVNAVTVEYTAGYGPGADTVPQEVQMYILAKLQVQFESSTRIHGRIWARRRYRSAGSTDVHPGEVTGAIRKLDRRGRVGG